MRIGLSARRNAVLSIQYSKLSHIYFIMRRDHRQGARAAKAGDFHENPPGGVVQTGNRRYNNSK